MSPDLELNDEQRRKMDEDAAEALTREGLEVGVVEVWEDGYRAAKQKDAFEWWYFDDHWYWGRAHVADFSMIFVQITTAKVIGIGSLKLPVFYLAKGDEVLTDDGLPLRLMMLR